MNRDPEISWEGHLSGLAVGLLLALIFRQKIIKQPKYEWEKEDYNAKNDLFMSHFDENGNFIEKKTEDEIDNQDSIYNYIFKENKED
ncbi:hypothetical protein [Gillisia marina]|uniref:hypothetical protein n=1 Tax=Gillisia marina TaxID=1167637 RepID=UPI0012DCA777|nr:hypothetical protein [Gillisia marina]